MRLSVVIVARNEEAIIGRCLASTVEHAGPYGAEIILVDSASEDRTVGIARDFPVTIIQLRKASRLSPGAGRYVGTQHCHGKFLLFLDGDMILCKGFLEAAFTAMEQQELGGVCGRLLFVPPGGDVEHARIDAFLLGRQPTLGGGALYRRAAIEVSGTFNPFLNGEEERELAYRLRQAGYALERLSTPMAYHFDKPKTRDEVREKSSQFIGVGQVLRGYAFTRLFWELMLPNVGIFSLQMTVIVWMLGLVVTTLAGSYSAAGGFAAVGLGGVLLLVVLKGGAKFVVFLRSRIMVFLSLVKGLRVGMPDSRRYEVCVNVIKTQGSSQAVPRTEE